MNFNILTIFPDLIYNYCEDSILARAQKSGKVKISAHDFRDFTTDKHHRVDDKPFGGGPGMILQVEPIYNCLKSLDVLSTKFLSSVIPAKAGIQAQSIIDSRFHGNDKIKSKNDRSKTKIIIMDPDGKKFDQKMAKNFSKLDNLVIICGRYEGFDERVYKFADERVSVGDYVLAGGELPALIITEATARLIPGVLGNADSLTEETFNNEEIASPTARNDKAYFEYPQYTRPENFNGQKAPKILLSGDHKKIKDWRTKHKK